MATSTSATIGISESRCCPARSAITLVTNSAEAQAPTRQSYIRRPSMKSAHAASRNQHSAVSRAASTEMPNTA